MMKDYTDPDCSANGNVTADNIKPQSIASSSSHATGIVSVFSKLSDTFANGFFGLFSKRASAQSTPQVKQATGDKNWETITQYINSAINMHGLGCKSGDDQSCADTGFASAQAASDASAVGITGDTRAIAQLLDKNDNITFQTPANETAFKQIVDKGFQNDCGVDIPISPVLLSILQALSDPAKGASAYQIRIGVFSIGHGCDGGEHPRGNAVDINGVGRGGVMSPNNQLHFEDLNAAQLNVVRQFYQDVGNSFPEGYGGMGQSQCFPGGPPPKRAGVVYFPDDPCNHLHIDARKNK
jgi:hypothetical protein